MKKRVVFLCAALILAVGLTACGEVSSKSQKSENKKDEQNVSENKESKDSDEDAKYSPIVAKDVKVADSEYPYQIKVNRAQNCITVYTLDKDEEYTVPVRSLICSTGGELIPTGTFQLGETVEWQMLPNGDFGRYVTRLIDNVVIRSVSYKAQSEDSLDVDSYNCLGDTIEDSSIVLGEADAQWIAENCPDGTQVEVYDNNDEAGPLGKPLARLISDKITWDPTNTNSENAWYVPVSFFGVEDKTVEKGKTPDLLEGITAKDKYGKDLTASIKVYGEVNINKAGDYKINYSCENSNGEKREIESVVTVVDDSEEKQPATSVQPENTPQPTTAPQATIEPQITLTPETASAAPTVSAAVPATASNSDASTTVITTITTVEEVDEEPPTITFTAKSAIVSSIKEDYLRNRIRVTDYGSGVDDVYINVCRIPDDGSYVVIYEAFDHAGNSSCVSETVYLQ